MNHAPSIGFCPPKDLLPLHPNQQKFQIPKIEVLYKPSKAIFWGWGFPYIALTYSLYRSFVPPFSGPEMFGDPNAPKMNYDDYIQKQQPLVFQRSKMILQAHMGVSENSGFSPQIIHFNRDFHYFHHPFWGVSLFSETSTWIFSHRIFEVSFKKKPPTSPIVDFETKKLTIYIHLSTWRLLC